MTGISLRPDAPHSPATPREIALQKKIMEKILIAIDSRDLDHNTVRFACHLARLTGSKLTAVFLEDLGTQRRLAFEAIAEPAGQASLTLLEAALEDAQLPVLREKNILLFKKLAHEEGVRSTIYLDRGVPAEELIAETLFADLLVVDATTFAGMSDEPPTGFVKNILHDAGCPVIIAPETYNGIDNILFCYDGGRSSLFAMKQFAYLFPQLCTQHAKVIDIRDGETPSAEQARVIAWLKIHFADVEWLPRGPHIPAALFSFLLDKADDLVVMGAYGKGLLTSFFTDDPALGITRTTSVPIFITHH